jgi:hypothetical protein
VAAFADVTLTPSPEAIARRMGERAGRRFLASGIWPRCPFRGSDHPVVVELAAVWRRAIFSTVGPVLTSPRPAYWIPGRGLHRSDGKADAGAAR